MNNEINYVSPFKKFCITIGNLPTAYIESMSYYEGLTYLVNYLSNNVIPALNNNSEVVEELQKQFTILKNYVDNYFDNLDVQEEINNKLDEMAESGELTDIIAQYLGLAGLMIYNSVADLKVAENLSNGSSVKTLGYYSYNSGGGALYKVRTILNTDVVDDKSIISLANNSLVAELISNTEVNVRQFGAVGDGTTDDTNSLQAAIDYCINNNLNLLINSTSQFYKTTKPLKLLCGRSPKGYWAGTGLKIHGENKGNSRIVKIGNDVLTGESETQFNNKNTTLISIHSGTSANSGTGVIISDLSLENYEDDEFNINNTSYGLYTNVSRSTYKNLNIVAYKGIISDCFSCLFDNLYFICTEEAFSNSNGTSNTYRFMYTNSCLNPYIINSSYSSLINVCCERCTGTIYHITGMSISLINCGTESPNATDIILIDSKNANVTVDNLFIHRQIGTDDNETDIGNCAVVHALNSCNVDIQGLTILEQKHLTGTSYIFSAEASVYLMTNIQDIKYNKNFTGSDNAPMGMWKNSTPVKSPQRLNIPTAQVNYFVTGNKKIFPYIGGYYDPSTPTANQVNSENMGYMKKIFLDCKDKLHNENGDDTRYISIKTVGDIQLYNDPLGRNALGLVTTSITNNYTWDSNEIPIVLRGDTASRPSANKYIGLQYFDTTLGIPIWWNGTIWVNASGTQV